MDDFEDRLRRVALRAPSEALDRRVEAILNSPAPRRAGLLRRAIPLWAAALIALLCGLAGAGLAARGRADTRQVSAVQPEAHEVYAYPTPNPFDWSGDAAAYSSSYRAEFWSSESGHEQSS